eukprot:evm.model.NODE_9582_length_4893_cov_29.417332.1
MDKAGLSKLWGEVLGVPTTGTFRSEKENVDEDILRLGAPGSPWAVEVDLMQPIDPSKSPKGKAAMPVSGEGVLIELVQAPPEVVEAYEKAAIAAK